MTKISGHGRPKISPPAEASCLCLLKLNMPADGTLEGIVTAGEPTLLQANWGFYTVFTRPSSQGLDCNFWPYGKFGRLEHISIALKSERAHSRLVELGVYCKGLQSNNVGPLELCHILNITIRPRDPVPLVWNIIDIQVAEPANASAAQKRLTWALSGMRDSKPFG